MKTILIGILSILTIHGFSQTSISTDDLKIIIGNWEGSLTYIDYQTKKPFTMPANLVVELGKNEKCLTLSNYYPKEPKANGADKIKISKNGSLLNKHLVTKREVLDNGQLLIQTEYRAKDADKRALIRQSYIFSTDFLEIKKEVQFEGSNEWIKRNEYSYSKEK